MGPKSGRLLLFFHEFQKSPNLTPEMDDFNGDFGFFKGVFWSLNLDDPWFETDALGNLR